MASKTIQTCDVCGKEPATTTALAIGATVGEVDLCERHAKALDAAVKPYVSVARTGKATAPRTAAKATAKKASAKKTTAKKAGSRPRRGRNSTIAAIRNWGWENGFEVATRGRLKPELTTAYNAAHSSTGTNGTTPAAAPATETPAKATRTANAPAKKAAKPRAKKAAAAKPAKAAKTPAKKARALKVVA